MTIKQISIELDCSVNKVKNWLKKYNLKTKPLFHNPPDRLCKFCGGRLKKSSKKFCCSQCQIDYYYKKYIEEWRQGEQTGMKGEGQISPYIRRFLLEKYDYRCSQCGWNERNIYTDNIPLEVEHIDGNYSNNKEYNLDLLCPNCHSLTKTYKGANRGNGRKSRKY